MLVGDFVKRGTDSMKKTEACGRGDDRGQLGGLHELRREDDGRSKTIPFFGVRLGVVVGSYPVGVATGRR